VVDEDVDVDVDVDVVAGVDVDVDVDESADFSGVAFLESAAGFESLVRASLR